MEPETASKKRKREEMDRITNEELIKKGFNEYYTTLPNLTIVCKDGKVIDTCVFGIFLKDSERLRSAYEAPLPPTLDVSSLFSIREVEIAISCIIANCAHDVLRTVPRIAGYNPSRDSFLEFDPDLCTAVIQFLDFLGLARQKAIVLSTIRIGSFGSDDKGNHERNRVKFIICYLKRGLTEDPLYCGILSAIRANLGKHCLFLEENEEMLTSHNVFKQICMP